MSCISCVDFSLVINDTIDGLNYIVDDVARLFEINGINNW
jgi:hypothetical protein